MKISISYLIAALLLAMFLSGGCNKTDENNPVSTPSNKFVGKWKSETPVQVKIKTDFCTNVLEDVATMDWDVNWEVTETDDPNVVNITMHYSSSNYNIVNPECNSGTGYLPEPQPIYMKGYITDNTLSVEYDNQEIFTVDYVNNKMTGQLSYSYCMVYCQEIYTDENDFSIAAY
jgi:hypothetical protein